MLRKVRKKVATAISKVEQVEDFNYGSWLRSPPHSHVELGRITSVLRDTSKVNLSIPTPVSDKRTFVMEESELMPELKLKDYFFKKIRSNAVFFMMHNVMNRGIDLAEIEPRPIGYSAKSVDFLIKSLPPKEYRVKFNLWAPVEYKAKLDVPQIFDYLSEMVPVVYNIQLLKFEDITDSTKATFKIKVKDIDLTSLGKSKIQKITLPDLKKTKKVYKVKVPGMGSYKSNLKEFAIKKIRPPEILKPITTTFQDIKTFFADISFSQVAPFKYYDAYDENMIEVEDTRIKGYKDPKSISDLLRLLLSNVQKVKWDERKDLNLKLLPYEETGSKFLVENEFALLQDEFGLDTDKELIAAIKFIFGNKVVRSALIVSSQGRLGDIELSKRCNIEIGWADKLNKYCPEIPAIEISGDNDTRADLWKKSALIYLADYETVVNDLHLKILEENKLKNINCIVLDDANLILGRKEKGKDFLHASRPKILWAVSSLTSDKLQEDINSFLGSRKIESLKIRKKESVIKDSPKFIWHEEWLHSDKDQIKEYKEGLVECQKELRRVLESGNPFRFQANIFTLLHRMKQIGNFAPGNTISPKTDLLLEQVSIIKENEKKVIILSQYDRLGTKKIEKLFEQKKINYILAPGSLSAEEMRKTISLFKTKKEIIAFISDAKLSRLNFQGFNVPYVIRFDQWWNPIATWELEDMFISEEDELKNTESINIYNYYMLGSTDQQLRELLHNKGFLNKNIFEMMQSKVYDELIMIDEWLRLFNMPASEEQFDDLTPEKVMSLINSSTLNFFRTILNKFFVKIGYAHVDIVDEPNSSSFNVVGESKRNNRSFYLYSRVVLEGNVSVKMVEDIVMQSASSINSRVFIITKGEFEPGCEKIIKDNVTLLDGYSFARYLIALNIVNSMTADPMANILK